MSPSARRIGFDIQTVTQVPFAVLENAHWRPQAAKLVDKYKRTLLDGSAKSGRKGLVQKLRKAWLLEETWINHSLRALLASLPANVIASVLSERLGASPVDLPFLATLDYANIRGVVGDPDFILLDETACVLGESKVAAQPNSQRYSFEQFSKYMTLGVLCECSRSPAIRRKASHLILVPDATSDGFCSDHECWSPRVVGTELFVDADKMSGRDRKGRRREFDAWCDQLEKTVFSESVRLAGDVDENLARKVLDRMRKERTPVAIPTFVVTWAELLNGVLQKCEEPSMFSLRTATGALCDWAYGIAAVPTVRRRGDAHLDRFVATKVIFSQAACMTCARLDKSRRVVCAAFPNGIPTDILVAKNDHKVPYPGDGGLTYLSAQDADN